MREKLLGMKIPGEKIIWHEQPEVYWRYIEAERERGGTGWSWYGQRKKLFRDKNIICVERSVPYLEELCDSFPVLGRISAIVQDYKSPESGNPFIPEPGHSGIWNGIS